MILKDQVIVTVLSKIDEKLASTQMYQFTICSKFSPICSVLLHHKLMNTECISQENTSFIIEHYNSFLSLQIQYHCRIKYFNLRNVLNCCPKEKLINIFIGFHDIL